MADGIISFPFRYAPSGRLVTSPDGSDAEISQLIACGLLTRQGERPLNPLYGVPDPAFAGIDTSDVQTLLRTFGPRGILVQSLNSRPRDDSTVYLRIGWTREDV